MSFPSGQRIQNEPRQMSPVVIGLLVAGLLLFVIWRGWSAFAGPPTGKLPPPPTETIQLINAKAKECQGDFNRLSPEDQAKVQKITMGFGVAAMSSTYQRLQQKPK